MSDKTHAASQPPAPQNLLDTMCVSESPATVSDSAATGIVAQAINPEALVPQATGDLWDLFDKLPTSTSDFSVTCSQSAKQTVGPQAAGPQTAIDWWDSFEVSELSVAGHCNSEKAMLTKAPPPTGGFDELEDFLNSLATEPVTKRVQDLTVAMR